MKLLGAEMVIAGVVAGAACAALLAALRRALERQRAAERQLAALAATVNTLQARVAELSRGRPPGHEMEPVAVTGEYDPERQTLAVMAAAASVFVGKTARIRSPRVAPGTTENVSPWSQQGRVIVQTSHNLRGRE